MMKKKIVLAGMIIGCLTMSLAGCNTSSPMAEKEEKEGAKGDGVTIQFWNSFTGTDGDVLREIVERYNKENDKGITVEMDIMPADSMEEKLPAAIASKTAPALVVKGNFLTPTYTDNEIIVPIDDFFEATGTAKENFSEESLKALEYQGKQMMIPMQVQSTFLYWNKDLFKAAGLDSETPPTTWEQVAEYAEKITDSSKKIYGVGFPVTGAPCYFDAMFKANGGDVFSEDGTKSIVNSEANLKTLEYIQELAKAGHTPVGATGADTDNLMLAGQLGIYCGGPWLISGLKEAEINFGVTGMPTGEERAAGVIEVQGFGVTSTCSEAEKEAAYDFIAYWNTDQICKEWSLKNGYPPYLKSLADDEEIQKDEIVSALSSISDFGYNFAPGVKAASQVNTDVLFPMIENVIAGNEPQEELQKAEEEINKILSEE